MPSFSSRCNNCQSAVTTCDQRYVTAFTLGQSQNQICLYTNNLAFQLFLKERLLRAPWTARRSNQSNPKGINLDYSLEGLMLKLKPQYFGHLVRRANSLEKTLRMLGKIESKRRRGRLRMRWLDSITDSMDTNLRKL